MATPGQLPGPQTRIKIALNAGESGWAEDLGDGTARIMNVPFDGDWNLRDLVTITQGTARRRPGRLLERVFRYRSTVEYAEAADYRKLAAVLEKDDWAGIEGAYGPGRGHNGLAVVAHRGEVIQATEKRGEVTLDSVILARRVLSERAQAAGVTLLNVTTRDLGGAP